MFRPMCRRQLRWTASMAVLSVPTVRIHWPLVRLRRPSHHPATSIGIICVYCCSLVMVIWLGNCGKQGKQPCIVCSLRKCVNLLTVALHLYYDAGLKAVP